MIGKAEELIRRIKEQAQLFVIDNIPNPSKLDFIIIENAMLVGATIKGVLETEQLKLELCEKPSHVCHVAEIPGDYYAEEEWRSDGAWCESCGLDMGWYCPKSPDHICQYEKGDSDCCDFCEMPSERK